MEMEIFEREHIYFSKRRFMFDPDEPCEFGDDALLALYDDTEFQEFQNDIIQKLSQLWKDELLPAVATLVPGELEFQLRDKLVEWLKIFLRGQREISTEVIVKDGGRIDILLLKNGVIVTIIELKRPVPEEKLAWGEHRFQIIRYVTQVFQNNPNQPSIALIVFNGYQALLGEASWEMFRPKIVLDENRLELAKR